MTQHKTMMALLTIALVTPGCGTMATVGQHKDYPNQIYSGTAAELSGPWAIMHAFLDIPFSFVADTVLLPYTIPATIVNAHKSPEQRRNEGIIGNVAPAASRPAASAPAVASEE